MTNTFDVRPGVPGTEALYYSNNDREACCVGHLRGDFGSDGNAFYTSWTPHSAWESVDERFSQELTAVVQTLRRTLLKSRTAMRAYIRQHPTIPLDAYEPTPHGYQVETTAYQYYIRCTPARGLYDLYIYCYQKEASA